MDIKCFIIMDFTKMYIYYQNLEMIPKKKKSTNTSRVHTIDNMSNDFILLIIRY